jgi:hypothetical protein
LSQKTTSTSTDVVFVPAVEGRDIDALAARVARSSRALEAELLAEG